MSKYAKEVNKYLLKVQHGDIKQIGKVFDLTANHLRIVAAVYLANKSNCDDVVSDVFCRAIQYIDSFDPTQDGYNWLCKIAERVAYSYNIAEQELLEKTVSIEAAVRVETDDGDTDGNITLLSALEILSQDERDILCDYFYAKETYDEIADKRGVVKSAIYKRVKKALKKMNKFLKSGEQKG